MEIGSEFWLENMEYKNQDLKNKKNEIYFLSGRTAIDYALDILEKNKKIENVYVPSYCCNSMLQPFIERNIKIEFYTVSFKDGNIIYNIDCEKKCDLFFAMNYFGFSKYNMDYYINIFKNRDIYVLEDSTHSWLSKRKYNYKSDLVIASLRKWFPIISGGILLDPADKFNINQKNLKENTDYINLKKQAMIEKAKYVDKHNIDKEIFLTKFKKSNERLKEDYKSYKMDKDSYEILKNIDIHHVIEKRINNVKKIYEFLEKQKEIQYLKSINLEDNCPIFVPIFLTNDKRNLLKKKLISNKVYCPNHWEIPDKINNNFQREIYNMELSLICDQRYCEKDIERYIKLIKNEEI